MVHPSDPKYPRPTTNAVTLVMKSNRRSNTKPELSIRSHLHKKGFRFRKDFNINIQGKNIRPDIVFTKVKLAIFIDGCFWHLCPDHGHIPKSNVHYWEPKLYKNRNRDIADTILLESNGWNVMRIWEHIPPIEAADNITNKLLLLMGK